MSILLIYLLVSVLISLLGIVALLNFVRYRFKGDKTILIFVLFIISYLGSIVFTVAQFRPESDTQPDQFSTF